MLEFFLMLLHAVWKKGLLSRPYSSRDTEPEEKEPYYWFKDAVSQYPEQMSFDEIEVEAGE